MTALCRPGNSFKHMVDVHHMVKSGLSGFVKITLLNSLSDGSLKAAKSFREGRNSPGWTFPVKII